MKRVMPAYKVYSQTVFEDGDPLHIPPEAVHATVEPAGAHKVRVIALIPLEEGDEE